MGCAPSRGAGRPVRQRLLDLRRVDGLLQLVPGPFHAGLQGFPALLARRLQLVQLAARLLVLFFRLRLRQLLLILEAPLGGGLLRLRLHLLQLRAPFRHLRFHLRDVGGLHLLHAHPVPPSPKVYAPCKVAVHTRRRPMLNSSDMSSARFRAPRPRPARDRDRRRRPDGPSTAGPRRESRSPRAAAAARTRSRTTASTARAPRRSLSGTPPCKSRARRTRPPSCPRRSPRRAARSRREHRSASQSHRFAAGAAARRPLRLPPARGRSAPARPSG